MPNMRPATAATSKSVDVAMGHLRLALEASKDAECPKLAAKIRSAISSADGAKRHAQRRHVGSREMVAKLVEPCPRLNAALGSLIGTG